MIREFVAGQNRALESSTLEEIGIGGFTLFARVNDSTNYQTQAPTSVVEDGTYLGDHLINAPIRLNISGDVSDVFVNAPVQSLSAKRLPSVGQVTSLIPGRTTSQAQRVNRIINTAMDRYRQIDNAIKQGQNVFNLAGNKASGKPIREQFVDFIEAIHYGKQLVSISMPFRLHDSMAITDVTITRDNQRNALTFSLTAQKFRIAKTVFTDISAFYRKPSPPVESQVAGVSNKGVQSPESGTGTGVAEAGRKEKSVLSAILGE